MSFVLTSLTLVATLFHSVLGCCWYHAHPVSNPGRPIAAASTPATPARTCPCHSRQRTESPPADAPTPADHEPEACHQSMCVYVDLRSDAGLGMFATFCRTEIGDDLAAVVTVEPQSRGPASPLLLESRRHERAQRQVWLL